MSYDANLLLQKSPDSADLARLCADIASKYYEIGTLLGVNKGDLEGLLTSPMANKVKLSQVFQKWMDAYKDVTWDKIIKTLADVGENKTRVAVIKYLGEKDAHEKYFDQDNFEGL